MEESTTLRASVNRKTTTQIFSAAQTSNINFRKLSSKPTTTTTGFIQ
jgi:hypothetical protein